MSPLSLTLKLKVATQILCTTLQLMMMYFNTKSSVVQKTLTRETSTNTLNICCDLDLRYNNPIFSQHTLAYEYDKPPN